MEKHTPGTVSLDERLRLLTTRLCEVERRLAVLEHNAPVKPAVQPAAPAPAAPQPRTAAGHKYLGRTISLAKRDYERKYK
jgi:hypothetical protein